MSAVSKCRANDSPPGSEVMQLLWRAENAAEIRCMTVERAQLSVAVANSAPLRAKFQLFVGEFGGSATCVPQALGKKTATNKPGARRTLAALK